MSLLFAGAPPLPTEARILAGLIGVALGAILTSRMRGNFSMVRGLVAISVAAIVLVGIDVADISDQRGIAAFVLGVLAGGMGATRGPSTTKGGAGKGLIGASLIVGPLLGFSVFAVWRWVEKDLDLPEQAFFLAAFVGIGTFAGALVATILAWFGLSRYDKDPA